jgi:hypothetical protein
LIGDDRGRVDGVIRGEGLVIRLGGDHANLGREFPTSRGELRSRLANGLSSVREKSGVAGAVELSVDEAEWDFPRPGIGFSSKIGEENGMAGRNSRG